MLLGEQVGFQKRQFSRIGVRSHDLVHLLQGAFRFTERLIRVEPLHLHVQRKSSLLLQFVYGRNYFAVLPLLRQPVNSLFVWSASCSCARTGKTAVSFGRRSGALELLSDLSPKQFCFGTPFQLDEEFRPEQSKIGLVRIVDGELV